MRNRSLRPRSLFALVGLVVVTFIATTLSSCGSSSDEHYQKALELEQRLLAKGSEITYADPGYLAVARELEQVRPWSNHRDEARALLKKIKEARRIRLNDVRSLDYLPDSLEGVSLASFVPPQVAKAKANATGPRHTTAPDPEAKTVGASAPRSVSTPKPVAEPASPATKTVSNVTSQMGAPQATKKQTVAKTTQKHNPVILYRTSWCPYCRKTASYLRRKGVDFVEKDIEKDPRAAQELVQKVRGYGGVPVVDIDGTIIRGYSPEQIDAVLARRNR